MGPGFGAAPTGGNAGALDCAPPAGPPLQTLWRLLSGRRARPPPANLWLGCFSTPPNSASAREVLMLSWP